MKLRLTKDIVQRILNNNEGFTRTTSYKGNNSSCDYRYVISKGKLLINEVGKTSWSDSRYNEHIVADIEQARRFIRKFLACLNLNGIDR